MCMFTCCSGLALDFLIKCFFTCLQFLQRVFSVDTIVKPLPPAMAYNVSRNLHFFLRIFTQFWGKFLRLIWDIVACGAVEVTACYIHSMLVVLQMFHHILNK